MRTDMESLLKGLVACSWKKQDRMNRRMVYGQPLGSSSNPAAGYWPSSESLQATSYHSSQEWSQAETEMLDQEHSSLCGSTLSMQSSGSIMALAAEAQQLWESSTRAACSSAGNGNVWPHSHVRAHHNFEVAPAYLGHCAANLYHPYERSTATPQRQPQHSASLYSVEKGEYQANSIPFPEEEIEEFSLGPGKPVPHT
mmetsp:Transcript_44213/g.117922  ORF Transcript_44213/g.117922 Transcript_44213/m.117922 type:complete len:198 (+) Transcript_44213:237-830(+)